MRFSPDLKIAFVEGNVYTDMIMDGRLLADDGISLHVKGDVFFGVMKRPDRMKPNDFYLGYEEFVKRYGPIYDIIACSNMTMITPKK